jgi:tetratricopeptide (TPR) repeat protein
VILVVGSFIRGLIGFMLARFTNFFRKNNFFEPFGCKFLRLGLEGDFTTMKTKLFGSILLLIFAISANAQNLGQVADKTFGYVKAGTFGKPEIIKRTSKFSIGQVRVHYKLVTSRSKKQGDNSADLTTYLESDLTKGDLQNLTNEFYAILSQKLNQAGIGTVDWKAIEATETFQKELQKQAAKQGSDYDGKAGQAWVSFTAFDAPVLLRYKPYGWTELIGNGQQKAFKKLAEQTGGNFLSMDLVVDFASITLDAEIKQDKGFIFYGDPYFRAEYRIGGMMNIPAGYIWMSDAKNEFDQYKIDLPIAERTPFTSAKPYEDASKASAKNKDTFGDGKIKFTPVIIPTTRDAYLNAARKVLTLYAEMFVEKIKFQRGGATPNNDTAQKDSGKTIEQVTAEAKKNNEPTPVTTGELLAAAQDAKKAGNTKLALQYLDKAIKASPDSVEALEVRMIMRMEAKEYKNAAKDAEAILKIDSNNFQAQFSLGTAHFFRADYDKAAKILGQTLNNYPNSIEVRVNYAMSLLGQKKYDEALNILNQGIRMNPSSGRLYLGRAAYYKLTGNAAAAQADETKAAQLGN